MEKTRFFALLGALTFFLVLSLAGEASAAAAQKTINMTHVYIVFAVLVGAAILFFTEWIWL